MSEDNRLLEEYIANFEKAAKECPWPGTAESYEKVCEWLKELKDKRTERTKGEWKNVGFMIAECSVCGTQVYELEDDNFCPNCGADMRGEQ